MASRQSRSDLRKEVFVIVGVRGGNDGAGVIQDHGSAAAEALKMFGVGRKIRRAAERADPSEGRVRWRHAPLSAPTHVAEHQIDLLLGEGIDQVVQLVAVRRHGNQCGAASALRSRVGYRMPSLPCGVTIRLFA